MENGINCSKRSRFKFRHTIFFHVERNKFRDRKNETDIKTQNGKREGFNAYMQSFSPKNRVTKRASDRQK